MRKISINIEVGYPVREAAKYAVALIKHIDPAMLGQFVNYERLCNEIRDGLCVELPAIFGEELRHGSYELQEAYLYEGNDPVFEYANQSHTLVIRAVL